MRAVLNENPKSAEDWLRWSYHHLDSHRRIIDAVYAKSKVILVNYPIDPITPQTIRDFLQFNSRLHIDMNGILRLQSADLLSVNFEDERQKLAWIDLHAREHEAAELALGI